MANSSEKHEPEFVPPREEKVDLRKLRGGTAWLGRVHLMKRKGVG